MKTPYNDPILFEGRLNEIKFSPLTDPRKPGDKSICFASFNDNLKLSMQVRVDLPAQEIMVTKFCGTHACLIKWQTLFSALAPLEPVITFLEDTHD